LSDRALRVVAAIVALVGVGIAAYLTWAHYAGATLVCVRGGGCETVQHSSYSEIAAIPVALLGLVSYATIVLLLGWDSPNARMGAAVLALVGLLFSAYLLVLQLFVIHALCIWCVVNDVVIAPALAFVTALRLREVD
jgi:uncharacterized membrane protein